MSTQELISQLQRERKAVIYIRQSTPHQVLTNQESLKLQYALKERAQELGWLEHTIEVIDCDLGMSGATATAREGFKELVAEVTLGQVGIILSSEVTRLSRNCSDWYQLLDVCAVKDCLIGDRDGVYDPRTPNGRLLLGLKGQLSEMELFAIRARLTAGLLNKARRGDLVQRLPVGLIREPDGMVTKDPDREVQARLLLVFETYAARGSVSKVVRHFHRHALLVPRRDTFGILVWNRANNESVQAILRNPAYAGMFVYGRTGIPQGYAARKPLPMEQWKIVVEDRYPAYISREQYEKVQKMLKDNYAEYTKRQSRGVSRSGTALLQGIVYCGVCGHKMTMQYKGGARYVCNALQVQNCAPLCQHILADAVDAQVVGAFFEVLSPAELNLYAEAVKEELTRSEKLQMAQRQQCERLRYQARLAEKQFNQVDPENRLVAAELEKRWNTALSELSQAEKEYEAFVQRKNTPLLISQKIRAAFEDLGSKLPRLWNEKDTLSPEHKKNLLRALIDKVVLHRDPLDTVNIRIVWRGGDFSTLTVPIAVGAIKRLSGADEMEQLIVEYAREGKSDREIADTLTKRGYRSPHNLSLLESTVQVIRLRNRILRSGRDRHPRRLSGYLTVSQLSEKTGVSPHWIYDRIRAGLLQPETRKHTKFFPDSDAIIQQVKHLKQHGSYECTSKGGHQDG